MTLIAYCIGNMAGAQVFKTKDAPRYVSGTIACCICFMLEAIIILLWRLWYMRENRRRDRIVAESGLTKEEQMQKGEELGEQDVTDLQNPYFRYTMWRLCLYILLAEDVILDSRGFWVLYLNLCLSFLTWVNWNLFFGYLA